jgi:hypothetical protein
LTSTAFDPDATPTTEYPALAAIWTAAAPNEEDAPQIRIFFDLLSGSGEEPGLSRFRWRRSALIAA